MRLHHYIIENLEDIQQEWEDFAADFLLDAKSITDVLLSLN